MNTDAGFDAQVVKAMYAKKKIEANIALNQGNEKKAAEEYVYFNEELYKERYVTEPTNAWLESFKALPVCDEVKIKSWIVLYFTASAVLFIKRKLSC